GRGGRGGWARYSGDGGDGEAARYAAECGRFDTLQISVSIADQEAIDLALPAARARGMGVIAKRPLANAAWRHARKPSESYHHAYWARLRALDYAFLKGDPAEAAGTALRFTLAVPACTRRSWAPRGPTAGRRTRRCSGPAPCRGASSRRSALAGARSPSGRGRARF